MMSKPSDPTSGIEAADAEVPDLVLERGHAAGGEHPGHEAAVRRVLRRVLEEQHARGQLHAGLDDVEDVAAVLEKVCQFSSAFSTSACRERAQKS